MEILEQGAKEAAVRTEREGLVGLTPYVDRAHRALGRFSNRMDHAAQVVASARGVIRTHQPEEA